MNANKPRAGAQQLLAQQAACPCCSGSSFIACCGPALHPERDQRRYPQTAVALMRSRFVAFVLGDSDYLRRSWDRAQCPDDLDLERDDSPRWISLQVLDSGTQSSDASEDQVEFVAWYRSKDGLGQLHERSRFHRHANGWVYVDGEALPPFKPGRNQPCPCGSGRKYKQCCGR